LLKVRLISAALVTGTGTGVPDGYSVNTFASSTYIVLTTKTILMAFLPIYVVGVASICRTSSVIKSGRTVCRLRCPGRAKDDADGKQPSPEHPRLGATTAPTASDQLPPVSMEASQKKAPPLHGYSPPRSVITVAACAPLAEPLGGGGGREQRAPTNEQHP
jgi:hypothetical protein